MRILFLALIVVVVLVLLVRLARQRAVPPPRDEDEAGVATVRCAVCETYLAKDEAIFERGRYYCSPEHRDRDTGDL